MSPKEIDPECHLKQSNRLVEARYKLTLNEQRLVIAICSQIPKNQSNVDAIYLRMMDVASFCRLGDPGTKTGQYNKIKNLSDKLMRRTLQIKKPDGRWRITHWLQAAECMPGGILKCEIDNQLLPEFLQLKIAYLDTLAAPLMEFSRDYSARMYFILKKMLRIGDFEYELDFFRQTFQLPKSYKHFGHLKEKVLEPALIEINKKSDINVKWDYIKEGRSYTKIHFVVSAKRENKKAIAAAPTETKNEQTDEEKELLARLINPKKWNLTSSRAEQLVEEYGVDHVRKNLLYADKYRAGKANLGGWLVDCIRNDYAADERARKVEQERERVKQRERDESKFKPIVPKPPTETETKNKRTGNAGALAWLAKNQI